MVPPVLTTSTLIGHTSTQWYEHISTTQHTAHSTQHTAHSTQHTAHSTQRIVCSPPPFAIPLCCDVRVAPLASKQPINTSSLRRTCGTIRLLLLTHGLTQGLIRGLNWFNVDHLQIERGRT